MCRLFDAIDEDRDSFLSAAELKALIIGIRFDEINFDKDDAVAKIMRDFDKSGDDMVDLAEFQNGIAKWLNEARRAGSSSADSGPKTSFKILYDFKLVSGSITACFHASCFHNQNILFRVICSEQRESMLYWDLRNNQRNKVKRPTEMLKTLDGLPSKQCFCCC